MNKSFLIGLFSCLFLYWGCASTVKKIDTTDPTYKSPEFSKAIAAYEKAYDNQAEILENETFEEGIDLLHQAAQAKKANDEKFIVQNIASKATAHFAQATDQAEKLKVKLGAALKARKATRKLNGVFYEPDLWEDAEDELTNAVDLAKNQKDTNDILLASKRAEILYHKLELIALQERYLRPLYPLLDEAKSIKAYKSTPVTYHKGLDLVENVKLTLANDRTNLDQASSLAKEAAYYIKHAIYVSRVIQKIDGTDAKMEEFILNVEEKYQKIAERLNIDVHFETGLDRPKEKILNKIDLLWEEQANLENQLIKSKNKKNKKISQLKEELSRLQDLAGTMEIQLSELMNKEIQLKATVQQQKKRREKINRIIKTLLPNEGKVLIDGENVILRLTGLTFLAGKTDLDPNYYPLLDKAIHIFNEFPDSRLIIEGHTDSIGKDEDNKILSEKRAESIKQYISSHSNILGYRMKSIGYGETRPVSSNATSTGRSKNRRIDIVIHPVSDW